MLSSLESLQTPLDSPSKAPLPPVGRPGCAPLPTTVLDVGHGMLGLGVKGEIVAGPVDHCGSESVVFHLGAALG